MGYVSWKSQANIQTAQMTEQLDSHLAGASLKEDHQRQSYERCTVLLVNYLLMHIQLAHALLLIKWQTYRFVSSTILCRIFRKKCPDLDVAWLNEHWRGGSFNKHEMKAC